MNTSTTPAQILVLQVNSTVSVDICWWINAQAMAAIVTAAAIRPKWRDSQHSRASLSNLAWVWAWSRVMSCWRKLELA